MNGPMCKSSCDLEVRVRDYGRVLGSLSFSPKALLEKATLASLKSYFSKKLIMSVWEAYQNMLVRVVCHGA